MGGQQGGEQGWSRAGRVGVELGWEHPSAGAITSCRAGCSLQVLGGAFPPSQLSIIAQVPKELHHPGNRTLAGLCRLRAVPRRAGEGCSAQQAVSVKPQTGPLALWPVWTACHLGLLIEPTHVRSPLGGGLSPRLLASPLRALPGPHYSPENPLLHPQPGPAPPHCPLHVTPQGGPYTSRLAPLL